MSSTPVEIALVAAMDERRTIGQQGRLPWRLPADMRHFKRTTLNHPVIMGRRTHESIGSALPQRHNIVLSRNETYRAPGCQVVSGFDEALHAAAQRDGSPAMIIGGASLYRLALPRADWLVLTIVHGAFEGDTFFPAFDGEQWELVEHRAHPADDENAYAMSFVRLRSTIDEPRDVGSDNKAGALPEILRALP